MAINIKTLTTPKGIEFWFLPTDSVPLVSMKFAFVGGTSYDPEGKSGLAKMVSGLLDEGAGDMDATTFQRALKKDAIDKIGRAHV